MRPIPPPSALENNMQKLGLTWDDFDVIFISHNHPDHTGGFAWWQKGSFSPGLAQPDWTGKSVYVPVKLSYPGLSPQVASRAQTIATGMATLGVLPFKEVSFLVLLNPVGYEETLAVNMEGTGHCPDHRLRSPRSAGHRHTCRSPLRPAGRRDRRRLALRQPHGRGPGRRARIPAPA